ncbi:hypothetical protein GZOEXZXM_CDS0077 [Salmonella phage SeKF_64]
MIAVCFIEVKVSNKKPNKLLGFLGNLRLRIVCTIRRCIRIQRLIEILVFGAGLDGLGVCSASAVSNDFAQINGFDACFFCQFGQSFGNKCLFRLDTDLGGAAIFQCLHHLLTQFRIRRKLVKPDLFN